MKKPHVLNRSMFNQGGTSAYGKGITSNLVSDEQRQRFNYGGRVGYAGLPYPKRRYTDQLVVDPYSSPEGFSLNLPKINTGFIGHRGTGKGYGISQQLAEEEQLKEELSGMEQSEQDIFWEDERAKAQLGVNPDYTVGEEGIGLIEREKRITQDDTNGGQEIMTDSDWMDILEPTEAQKKRTKGKAQLGLAAGALDVFSQPTTAKKMKAAVPHLTKLGETATAQEDAIDKAVLQGKVLEKVYKGRETEKGKQTRQSAVEALLGLTGGTPMEKFKREIGSLKTDKIKTDELQTAVFNASGMKIKPKAMPTELEDQVKEAENKDNEGDIYIMGMQAKILQNGKFVDISWEDVFKLPELEEKNIPIASLTTPIVQKKYR